jgi:hypothetical protein
VAYKVVGGGTTLMPWNDVDPHAVAEGLLPIRRDAAVRAATNRQRIRWEPQEQ